MTRAQPTLAATAQVELGSHDVKLSDAEAGGVTLHGVAAIHAPAC